MVRSFVRLFVGACVRVKTLLAFFCILKQIASERKSKRKKGRRGCKEVEICSVVYHVPALLRDDLYVTRRRSKRRVEDEERAQLQLKPVGWIGT